MKFGIYHFVVLVAGLGSHTHFLLEDPHAPYLALALPKLASMVLVELAVWCCELHLRRHSGFKSQKSAKLP